MKLIKLVGVLGCIMCASAAYSAAPVERVVGGGNNDALGFLGPGNWTYGYNAQMDENGVVTGEAEFHRLDLFNIKVHVGIDCLVVDGNRAWISGFITQSANNLQLIGVPVGWTVLDNGQGADALPDESSEVFDFSGGFSCEDMLNLPLQPWPNGNIKVW